MTNLMIDIKLKIKWQTNVANVKWFKSFHEKLLIILVLIESLCVLRSIYRDTGNSLYTIMPYVYADHLHVLPAFPFSWKLVH